MNTWYRKLGRVVQYPFAYLLCCLIELDERISDKTLYQSQIELGEALNNLIEIVSKEVKGFYIKLGILKK